MADGEPAKYRRIAGDLRTAIREGEHAPGSRLPSKAALMGMYEVAVGTVDDALGVLRAEGLIYSERGKGTFVCDPLPEEAQAEHEMVMARIDGLADEVRLLRAEVAALKRATAGG